MSNIYKNSEKIYKQRVEFFERPLCSNFGYKYGLLKVSDPHDFVLKIEDAITNENETQLAALFKVYTENVRKVEKEMCIFDSAVVYEGMPVVVRLPEDGGSTGCVVPPFLRGEVVSFMGKKVVIMLVDIGGVFSTTIEEILPITVDFLRIPKVGINCRLANIRPDTTSEWPVDVKYREDFTGNDQMVTFVDFHPGSNRYEVIMEVNNVNVATKYFHEAVARPVELLLLEKKLFKNAMFPLADYSTWIGLKTHVFGVRVFQDVQEVDDKKVIKVKCVLQMQPDLVNTIQDSVVDYIQNLTEEMRTASFTKEPGVACLARFGDNEYFRAVILHKENDEQYKVDYVDYKEQAIVAEQDLIKLPDDLLQFPEGGSVCQITDFLSTSCTDMDKLENLVVSKDLYAVVDGSDPSVFGTELLVSLYLPLDFTGPDKSFSEIFVTERPQMTMEILQMMEPVTEADENLFLQPRLPDPGKLYPGAMLSVINDWDSMWIQLSEEIDMAVRVSTEMTHFYENGGCDDETRTKSVYSVGKYVAAKQPDEDECIWYRAKILEEKDGQLLLLYIDYGNAEWIMKEEVYPLHKYFAKDNLLCFKVSMM